MLLSAAFCSEIMGTVVPRGLFLDPALDGHAPTCTIVVELSITDTIMLPTITAGLKDQVLRQTRTVFRQERRFKRLVSSSKGELLHSDQHTKG